MTAPAHIIAPVTSGQGTDLLSVDLRTLPTLAAQIASLDAARATGDVEDYVAEWLRVSDELNEGASVNWGNHDACGAEGVVMRWVACDSQEEERRARFDALLTHCQPVEGFRAELRRVLISRGRYLDNRKTRVREIFAVVRAFLATGGELLIEPNPITERRRIDAKPEMNRFVKGNWSETDEAAAKAMFRLLQRWRAKPIIERIVRSLGERTSNHWIVLSRIGAERAQEIKA